MKDFQTIDSDNMGGFDSMMPYFERGAKNLEKIISENPKDLEVIVNKLESVEEIIVLIHVLVESGIDMESANNTISYIQSKDKRWLKIYAESELLGIDTFQ